MGAVTFLASDASLYVTVSLNLEIVHTCTDYFRAPTYASTEHTLALESADGFLRSITPTSSHKSWICSSTATCHKYRLMKQSGLQRFPARTP
jgi:hypothetical protein